VQASEGRFSGVKGVGRERGGVFMRVWVGECSTDAWLVV
jgi:hypothetical protein